MNLSAALRSSASLLSSHSRSSALLPRAALRCPRRCYSDEKPSSSGQQPTQEAHEKPQEKPPSPEAQALKAKDAEVADLTSRLRYLQADFLNLQRNAAREKEQQRDYAITRFASDLLETVDVLGLALKSIPPEALSETAPADSSSSPKTHQQYLQELHTGVEITNRQLLQTLFKYHVKPFDPTGEKFDPNRHEAMYQIPVPGKEPGTVLDCQKIGYTIKDRVLRAAQVGVVQDTS
ncbi:hypothetical protein AX14_000146 [Amanita brunnescens Koide BX004]|nr:hypothetical protein AX14_000146 [Amanita brunnescens Koide BX004]